MPHGPDVFAPNILVTARHGSGQNRRLQPSLKMKDLELKSGVVSRMPVQNPPPVSRRQQTDCAPMFRVVRPSPAILSAAIILGTATFVAVPVLLAQSLFAQNGESSKPAEAGKAEPTKADPGKAEPAKAEPAKPDPAKGGEAAKAEPAKPESGKSEPGKPEPGKSEPAKSEPAKSEPVKGEASAKDTAGRPAESAEASHTPAGPAGRGECAWLGERAVGLMWKDDLDTAFRHLDLYDRFGCPGEHIQVSFRCVVRQGNVQKDPKVAALFDDRVHNCWIDPARPAEPPSPPTAAVEKPGTK
jgi:hypothetical protein